MNKIWITREIVFEDGIVKDALFDAVRADTIMPFVEELIATGLLINWYTSLTASDPGTCPHYRIYVRVGVEHSTRIGNMFSMFMDGMEGLHYTEKDPIKPNTLSDKKINSIQAGAESALRLLKLFPFYKDRYDMVWGIALLKELLVPIRYYDERRLHFITANIGGSDLVHLKWASTMFDGYKGITDRWYNKWGQFGRFIRWCKWLFIYMKRRLLK